MIDCTYHHDEGNTMTYQGFRNEDTYEAALELANNERLNQRAMVIANSLDLFDLDDEETFEDVKADFEDLLAGVDGIDLDHVAWSQVVDYLVN